jgi:hypothetical protein
MRIACTLSATVDGAMSLGSSHLASPKDCRMESASSLLPSLMASAYWRYFLRILGPSFFTSSTWRSSGSKDLTIMIFLLALEMATFSLFSPPRLFSHPNLCMSLPSLFLA